MVERADESNPEIDYERRDLALRPLLFIALALVGLLGAGPLIVLVGFPSARHDVDRRLTVLPPVPRLQTHPRAHLEAYLSRERELLDSYGWVDRAHGIARVPITVEMQRLAWQGIPGFPQAPPLEQSQERASP
ncbi:MAG: hypothetical protein WAM52_13870 [Steroidobacteraceae bacterium]